MNAEIVIVFGTRPSYIKTAPIYRALRDLGHTPTVICTGQHRELIEQHMDALDMPVDLWLDVMRDSGGLNDTLSLVVDRVGAALRGLQPQLVIVQGDTTSALGAGLAAFHEGIPVAHVEAGLRSGTPFEPWPEEVNRIALDALASLLYAPTMQAAEQARAVNPVARVEVVGNPVVDSVHAILAQMGEPSAPVLDQPYVVLDLHRRESFGAPMQAMVQAVLDATKDLGRLVIWLVHPNPAVQAVAHMLHGTAPHLILSAPLPYAECLGVLRQADLLLTDSGGMVEEAISLGVGSLQLRDYTDRPEAIAAGCSWLAGRDPAKISTLVRKALAMAELWKISIRRGTNPYGDSHAGERIAAHVMNWLETRACHLTNASR